MAIPRIFISSTCYDLRYIRENMKYFISNMGYESILSEDGDVFYNPDKHTHDACLNEVKNCQIFVLIIGGRYGGKYLKEEKSITNKEYEEARNLKIPIFTLVERNVLSEHFVYQKNKSNPDADKIIYPSVDDIRIFEFIDQVRKNNYNNAIYPFTDFRDIEGYLKKQWAGMIYNFLTNHIETQKVSDLFEEIHRATDKIEYYTQQVALNTGGTQTVVLIKIYELMIGTEVVEDLKSCWKIDITPHTIVRNKNLDEICDHQINAQEEYEHENSITHGGPPYRCSIMRRNIMIRQYDALRADILKILAENGYSEQSFLEEIPS